MVDEERGRYSARSTVMVRALRGQKGIPMIDRFTMIT